jgi:hypothetical protein
VALEHQPTREFLKRTAAIHKTLVPAERKLEKLESAED